MVGKKSVVTGCKGLWNSEIQISHPHNTLMLRFDNAGKKEVMAVKVDENQIFVRLGEKTYVAQNNLNVEFGTIKKDKNAIIRLHYILKNLPDTELPITYERTRPIRRYRMLQGKAGSFFRHGGVRACDNYNLSKFEVDFSGKKIQFSSQVAFEDRMYLEDYNLPKKEREYDMMKDESEAEAWGYGSWDAFWEANGI